MPSSESDAVRHARRLGAADAEPMMAMASLLWRAGNDLSNYMTSAWETPGLRVGEADVLMAIRTREPNHTTPADLKAQFGLTSAGITNRLDALEDKELLQRKPHPTDRRSVTLHLSAEGERIADETAQAVARTMLDLADGTFTTAELDSLNAQLQRLIDVLADRR